MISGRVLIFFLSFFFFACIYPVVSALFTEKIVLSSLNSFGILAETQLTIDV